MKRFFVIAAILLSAVPSLFAQKVVDQIIDYTGFKNIEAFKNFEVKYVAAENYSVKLTVDERIAENVISVVKNNTLILDIDEKGYSKELKKELKAKNAIKPVVIAVVYAPSIHKVVLNNETLFTCEENIKSDDFVMELYNTSLVKGIAVDANAAKISMANKASGRFDIYAHEVEFFSKNSASTTLILNCNNLVMNVENSSVTAVEGEFKNVNINAKNSAELRASGTPATRNIIVRGSNSSYVDLDRVITSGAEVSLSNSALCKINAKDVLKVELLNNSHLIFNGAPSIDVERIVGSTLTKANDTKYNKNK